MSEMYEAEEAMSEKAPWEGMQGRAGTEPGHARGTCLHVFCFPVTTCSQTSRKEIVSPCPATFVAKVVKVIGCFTAADVNPLLSKYPRCFQSKAVCSQRSSNPKSCVLHRHKQLGCRWGSSLACAVQGGSPDSRSLWSCS